jgi:hypothetical protein
MSTVYQANGIDFPTPNKAIDEVERIGSGHVIKFTGYANIPGLLPAMVYRSSAMWSYQDGIWHSHYIHDGQGDKLTVEKPH